MASNPATPAPAKMSGKTKHSLPKTKTAKGADIKKTGSGVPPASNPPC